MKWKLDDMAATPNVLWFEVSPNSMESPIPVQGVEINAATINGAIRGTRLDQPHIWQFSGVLLTQSQYEDLRDWVFDHNVCRLTDHLNRQFIVRLTAFSPNRAPWRHYQWRHTYTMTVTTYQGPL